MPELVGAWAVAFGVTLLVEVPVAAWLLRDLDRPRWQAPAAAALCSALTHPVLWFGLPRFFDDYATYIVVGELGIIAVEALLLGALLRPGWRLALSTSALMNGASYLIGLWL